MRAFFFIKTFEKNSSITRFKQRCLLTNRGKSVFKKFGLSRLAFRRLALQGDLFGIKKSS
jgi:small subunit ribosomal protein S14